MKTKIVLLGALSALFGAGGYLATVPASAVQSPPSISAPMRAVVLPPLPAPPTTTTTVPVPVTTTTQPVAQSQPVAQTQPVAQSGPQPQTPGTTVQVPQCVVTWTVTEQLPEPMPAPTVGSDAGVPGPSTMTVQDSYDGNCSNAQAVAADHPGSTVQQVSLPQTS